MTGAFSDYFTKRRAAATNAVAVMLRGEGFMQSGDRRWKGLTTNQHAIEVALPLGFPDELPEIFRPPGSKVHVAHVDRFGKVCIAPETGTLLDSTRPVDIVRDAIERADVILEAKPEDQAKELLREYESYWAEFPSHIVSICPPTTETGECWGAELESTPPITLIAPTSDAAWAWARATGKTVLKQTSVFFVRLPKPLQPPPYGIRVSLREILRVIREAGPTDAAQKLKDWFARHGLPATLLVSAPLDGRNDVVVALQVPALSSEATAIAQKGFRPGRVPHKITVARAASEPVYRVDVDRADPDFLLPRGGALRELLSKTVAVVGCGSVGSFAAGALAASGVGHLVLVDPQTLNTENFQRHLLGASSLGEAKVDALSRALNARFPHVRITALNSQVQDALDKADSPVVAADVVLCALGEDNLELQLNEMLRVTRQCVHVWLDPLGVGGHVLRSGFGGSPGCFRCLFRSDPILGLVNMASLVAPGQQFQRSVAGCSGTFTPFGALDAERAGIEAAREVISCLTRDSLPAQLCTWVVSKKAVLDAGFALSCRAKAFAEDVLIRNTTFPRADCPVCSRRFE